MIPKVNSFVNKVDKINNKVYNNAYNNAMANIFCHSDKDFFKLTRAAKTNPKINPEVFMENAKKFFSNIFD